MADGLRTDPAFTLAFELALLSVLALDVMLGLEGPASSRLLNGLMVLKMCSRCPPCAEVRDFDLDSEPARWGTRCSLQVLLERPREADCEPSLGSLKERREESEFMLGKGGGFNPSAGAFGGGVSRLFRRA